MEKIKGFDISNLNAVLGTAVRRYSREIQSVVTGELTFLSKLPKKFGVKGEHVGSTFLTDSVLQPFQREWTAKSKFSVKPATSKVRQYKLDISLDNLDELADTWFSYLMEFDEEESRDEWEFPKWLVLKEILPKYAEELDKACWAGKYVPPKEGVAGSANEIFDGLSEIIKQGLSSGKMNQIVTGKLNDSTIVDQVRMFASSLPSHFHRKPGTIHMSKLMADKYWNNYRDLYGNNANYDGNNRLIIDRTMFSIEEHPVMENSERIWFTPPKNLFYMCDKTLFIDSMEAQLDKRKVNLLADAKGGIGRHSDELFFVNDVE